MDDREMEQPDRAECPECEGSGSVREIVGDGEYLSPCPSCAGLGYQLTRDEFANLDALTEDRDLRLVPEAAEDNMPSFASHAEEIEWHLAKARRSVA